MNNRRIKVVAVLALAFGAIYGSIAASAHGPLDLEYIDAMLMHHRDGIKMSQMATENAHHPETKKFASDSLKEQEKGIAELQDLRLKLYAGRRPSDGIALKADKRISVKEMKEMADADMKVLEGSGAKFDEVFLKVLTKHHSMAIEMSNEQIGRGSAEALKTFSRKTIDIQKKEIDVMARLLKKVDKKPARH